MDTAILSAIISAAVALLIAVLNYFVITPIRERKERMRQQIKNLYAPLYGIVCARLGITKEFKLNEKKLMLASLDNKEYTEREYMENFLLSKSGYASNELLRYGLDYVSKPINYDEEITYNFVTTLVQDFNRLKKKVRMEYNKEELKTGIPECVKGLREVYSNKTFN